MSNIVDIQPLEKIIQVEFQNKALLNQALSHSSTVNNKQESYERLELLGDRILGLIIVENLYHKHPDLSEGRLSKRMNQLTCGEALFKVYQALNIDQFVLLSRGEAQNGGQHKKSIGSAVIEAIIGAIYLDQSFDAARNFILSNWEKHLNTTEEWQEDAKSDLQSYVQSLGHEAPIYRIIKQTGPDHEPTIEIMVSVPSASGEEIASATASGASRRIAERIAAKKLLQELS